MIQRSSFVTTTWRVSHLVSFLAYAAYFCVHPVYSECCYSYSETKLQSPKPSSPTSYSVALTASSWTAFNSSGMTYKTTVAFSSGYFIELIPAGCTLVNQGTASCSQAGKSMLNLAFQKITAVGYSGGSSLYVDAAAVVGNNDGGEDGRDGRMMRKDYSTVPGSPSGYNPSTPQPPPAVVSVQICGEFCTLSTSCSVPTPNMTATPAPSRSITSTLTSLTTKTTVSPTYTGQMVTPPAPAPAPGTETNTASNKSAVIIGSIFAVVVVAFAVGYAVMRRNIARGSRDRGNGGGGGGKKKKEVDQEDIKYIRPPTTAPTLPLFPAPAATAATAAMTMRQLDSGSGGRGVGLESQSRFKKPSPPVALGSESRQQPTATATTRTATNTASAAPMLARGRSVREAALTRNDRQQQPSTGPGVVGADVRYLQERQRLLAMNNNTSASAPALVSSSATATASARAAVETSARSLVPAPTHTLPQPSPPANLVNVSVPVSISTMASLPLPVTTAVTAANGSKNATAAPAPAAVRGSNVTEWSAVDTADLEFLVISDFNSSAARQKNGSLSSSTPSVASIAGEKEEVLDDVDLYDDEREEMLLTKSKSLRYPWSSGRYADGNEVAATSSATNNVATTATTATFADTSPLRRVASASVSGNGGSNTANYNNNSRNRNNSIKYNNSNANTSNYRSPYNQQPGSITGPSSSSVPQLSTKTEQQQQQHYRQQQQQRQGVPQPPAQQQQQQYQQKQQKLGWAQSQDDLLMRARSMPRTTTTSTSTSTTAMNGGYPSRTMNTQHQQQQQQGGEGQGQRAVPRGLYGYL